MQVYSGGGTAIPGSAPIEQEAGAMNAAETRRREAVLRDTELRFRRRAAGRKARRDAAIRAASALRMAAATRPRGEFS
jgi:hypothetical protein